MPDDTRAKAEALFHRVVDLPPDERDAFLAAHAGDAKVREEVKWLLGYAGETVDVAGEDLNRDFPVIADVRRVLEEVPAGSLAPKTRLGPYQVLAPIGAGGMGEVYRAKDTRLDREVAVKILRGHMTDDPAALARFQREAKAVAALQHQNIVVIHDVGESEGTPYVVTELLRGETLRDRLNRSTPHWREVARYGVAIAQGLRAAHERGVIHRDLKPENVFLTTAGTVKLLDFGIARMGQNDRSDPASPAAAGGFETVAGTLLGTVHYMAPEQIRGEATDERSDIFSLGCVLHEALTGRLTFSGETFEEIKSAIVSDDPPGPGALGVRVPPGLDRVVLQCLCKEPAFRIQSARDLSTQLERFARPRPAWTAAILFASVLLVVVLSAMTLVSRSGKSRELPVPKQLTDWPSLEQMGSWSNDGKWIAFAQSPEGQFDIYRMAGTGSGEPKRLTESPADEVLPRWSPDGRYLAFASGRQMRGSIHRLELGTGAEEELAQTGIHSLERIDLLVQSLGSKPWSEDGTGLLYSRAIESESIALFKIDLTSSDRHSVQLTFPRVGVQDLSGSFMPGEDWILFTRARAPGVRGLWKLTPEGERAGEATPLFEDGYENADPAPWLDGQGIVFSSNRGGKAEIWELTLPDAKPRQLTRGHEAAWKPSVGPDGRILFDLFTHQTHLYSASLDGTSKNVVFDRPQDNFAPRFSPEGDAIIYHSRNSGDFEIWWIEPDTGKRRNLTNEPDATDVYPDWSPRGDRISFVSDRGGVFQLWTMKPDGSDPRVLPSPGLVVGPFSAAEVYTPRWAPSDGDLIGYLASGENGLEVRVVDPEGREPPGVAHPKLRGVLGFDWYRSSRQVIFVRDARRTSGDFELVPLDLASGREGDVLLHGFFTELVVASDGSVLTYCEGESHGNMSLHGLELLPAESPGGLPRPGRGWVIEKRPGQSHVHNGDISPSGDKVVYTRDRDTADIWILPADR